ncbi:LLM class F420-dependent oxidoreductase [Candidatus Entotheonella serta]|nr:LLM class F420-dependent oxidoreductase [Candidatus Entotheonella serta]
MKIDGSFGHNALVSASSIVERAQELESLGFDGLLSVETSHEPFFPLVLAAHHTRNIELRTSIAVALARSPMNLANAGHDLNALSQGRFTLGLGSQIRAHITRRFSMPWHGPAKQMRELIEATQAIWDCWYDGQPLNYTGDFYHHTLMTPEFTPKNIEHGRPKIVMAAVGPLMITTAAAVADGIVIHPFCTETYLRDVILPRVETELAKRDKSLADFEIQYPVFMAIGETEEQLNKAKEAVRYRIGFYASTPAYKSVLDVHGWGDLQPILRLMTKEGKWDELPSQISDDILETFAVVGEPAKAATLVKERFGDVVDRVTLDATGSPNVLAEQMAAIHA